VKPSPIRAFDDHRIGAGRAHRSVHQHRLEHGAGIGVQVNLGDRIDDLAGGGGLLRLHRRHFLTLVSGPARRERPDAHRRTGTGGRVQQDGDQLVAPGVSGGHGGRGVVRGVHRVADWAQLGLGVGVDADRGHRQDAAPGRG
jgi:hypothetical protein